MANGFSLRAATRSVDRHDGFATSVGTERFAARSAASGHVAPAHFRHASTGVQISSIGLGTYLGRPDSATDLAVEQAVAICLASGRVNILDTAINYRSQRAERSIGRGLARLLESGSVQRDEVFVATKAGYLAPDGESELTPSEWVRRELIDTGVLAAADIAGGAHAMTPRYLSDQIDRSRSNLGLATIDLLYLHNPAESQQAEVGAEEFRRRLALAFAELEKRRRDGSIRHYGIATWDSLRVGPDDPSYVSLESIVALAREIGGSEHGFRFVQFPFNLALPEAATLAVQRANDHLASTFDAAAALGLGCFTSVPLMQGRLARGATPAASREAATRAIQFARSAPGTIAPLVGQKSAEHLSQNLAIAARDPWERAEFDALLH